MNDESLFHQALEQPAQERAKFLDAACGDDAERRRRIEALLKAHDAPGSFLAKPVVAVAETMAHDETAETDRALPTLPGDYEIVRELGRGGMGVVYLAKQKSLGRAVAVKVLRPGEVMFGRLVKRFLEEARHLAQLRHPNIVSIHEVGQAGGEPYFTMDFVEGAPLSAMLASGSSHGSSGQTNGTSALADSAGRDGVEDRSGLLRAVTGQSHKAAQRPSGSAGQWHTDIGQRQTARQKLSPTQALAILKQAAAGVQHAHEHGIIHRDLKPANILVDGSGHAYVTDFGLARDMGQDSKLTRSGEVMGTPAYMAPEQVRGQKELIGEATDVHALGVILYEMLTGQLPYGGGAPADVIVRLMSDEPTPPRKLDRRIPRDLETICLKAMAKSPDRRYANVRAMLEDIRRFESGEPVLARRPSRLYRASRLAQRHWKIGAAVLATAVVILAIAPRLFDKSVEELLAWGKEQAAAGEPVGALRAYGRAYRKADGGQRREILSLILVAARSASKDQSQQKQIGDALWDVMDVDPDVSLQEFDYPTMEAWGKHHGRDLAGDAVNDEEKRRLMEFGEKRIQFIINGGYASDTQKKEAEKQLSIVRFGLSQLKAGSSALFEVPINGTPAELLKRAAANEGSAWTRGMAAFGAGINLEASGDKPGALAAYRQAFDLMRLACPTYSGLSLGINMGRERNEQQEAREPRLVREVVRAIRRLDPAAADPLRGGIRFRIVGPQFSRNEVIKLYAALWDPASDPKSAPFGLRGDGNGNNMVPSPPGSFPIQIDGTAWIGVADGKYRLSVFRAESGGRDGPPDPAAAKRPVELDFRNLPSEIEIHGDTVELKIPSYELETVALIGPAEGEVVDLPAATFRWAGLANAKSYWVQFGQREEIPGGTRVNFVLDAKTDSANLTPASLSDVDRAKLSPLKPGISGQWSVTAYNASGRKIGVSTARQFTVSRGLE